MELRVTRKKNGEHACLGEMTIDEVFCCYTLEDVVREFGPHGERKVMHETAIPAGRYRVTLEYSEHFHKIFPRLHDVPFFTGILIHPGNTDVDTWGCLLVGDKLIGETIVRGAATPAFLRVFEHIKLAEDAGEEVWITVVNEFPEPLK